MQLLTDWAIPRRCLFCEAASGRELACAACEADLARAEPSALPVVAVYAYRFPLDRAVQRFKYGGDLAIGRWLGRRLAECVAPEPRPDVLVAPPITAGRLRERGFNQSLEVARVVGRAIGVPCAWRGLRRTRETPAQAGLGRRARLANLRGAFECGAGLQGRRVAIVDDVVTTGATIAALAAVLRRAGAAEVTTWTVALTPPPGG